MRHELVKVSEAVELACIATGSGPPVVCLPGWSQAAEQSLPVADQLASRHRVIAVDHRGHGRSSQPARATGSTASLPMSTRCCSVLASTA